MANEITVIECDDITDDSRFCRIEPDPTQRAHLSQLYSQMPMLVGSKVLADSYQVVFPAGVYGELMSYVGGGQGTPIVNVNGRIIDHAALYDHGCMPGLLTCFSALSIVTGQYFLTEINHNFQLINERLDNILSFLNKDKEKGLEANAEFVQDAYKHYSLIMADQARKSASLTNVQSVRINANKNVKFYTSQLNSNKRFRTLSVMDADVNTMLSYADCLAIAAQTYVACSFLEYMLSLERNPEQAWKLQEELADYVDKHERVLSSSLDQLSGQVKQYKLSLFSDCHIVFRNQREEKRKTIEKTIAGKKGILCDALNTTAQSVRRYLSEENYVTTYYIDAEGNLYIPTV